MPGQQLYCPTCGTVAPPKRITRGSFGVEVLCWLLFLLPGLLYSLWRLSSRYDGCSVCGAPGLIPLSSPRAQQAMGGQPPSAAGSPQPPQLTSEQRTLLIVAASGFVLLVIGVIVLLVVAS